MELRQLKYFLAVVEYGSLGRAAQALGVVPSALSSQISALEGELSTRLLQRTKSGSRPTDAGIAFHAQAQLALRHADHAAQVARQARLTGQVSVGLAPSTAAVVALPFLRAMRQRYPGIRVRFIEALTGSLAVLMSARQVDVAIVFDGTEQPHWNLSPLLNERLFLIGRPDVLAAAGLAHREGVLLAELADAPLILPSEKHGLRSVVEAVYARQGTAPLVALEIDGLAVLMDAVVDGLGVTIQPGAATARLPGEERVECLPIVDPGIVRCNLLASLSDDEASPAGLAARVVLRDVAQQLVQDGVWPGASVP